MSPEEKKGKTGTENLAKKQQIVLEITDLNNLGCGVGHAPDGRAVFVAGAVDGDRVQAEIIKVNKSYAVGRLMQIMAPSPHREEGFATRRFPAVGAYIAIFPTSASFI